MRRSPHRLDPPDLPRRLGVRGLRGGEPALLSTGAESAARLQALLGLSDDELCGVLDTDALTLLSGQLEHRPELPILLDLLREAEERAGAAVLRRWIRTSGPRGRPLDALTRRDFPRFEETLADLGERGWILRGGG